MLSKILTGCLRVLLFCIPRGWKSNTMWLMFLFHYIFAVSVGSLFKTRFSPPVRWGSLDWFYPSAAGVPCRTSTARQKICQIEHQKECQKRCRKECQRMRQKDCQKECQKKCRKECQKISYGQYVKLGVTGRISIFVLAAICKDAWDRQHPTASKLHIIGNDGMVDGHQPNSRGLYTH